MKFRITAIDGADFVHNYKEGDGWELERWEPGFFGNLISTDGVNKAMPMDDEARALVHKITESEFEEWDTIDPGPSAEHTPYGSSPETDALNNLPDEAFSNGDGTGQVDLRLLPSGW